MKPQWYFDIEVIGGAEDCQPSPCILRGIVMSYLHPFFKRNIGLYALAVPSITRKLRVFASTRDELDALAAYLQGINWMRDYARLTYPLAVPSDFSGRWITYRRYRIPSLKADRKQGLEHGKLRERRLSTVVNSKMDYFKLRSNSNDQTFTLVVERKAGEPSQSCTPNGYGLSSGNNTFSLPELL